MKLLRLSGRKRCDFLRRKGNVFRGQTMTIRWLPSAPKHPNVDPSIEAIYVGTFAGTKLHKHAVKRNRMRRRCREALRIRMRELDSFPVTQLLLSPKIKSLDCEYAEILADIDAFLEERLHHKDT